MEYIREMVTSRIARKSDRELLKHVGCSVEITLSPTALCSLPHTPYRPSAHGGVPSLLADAFCCLAIVQFILTPSVVFAQEQ